MPVTGDQVVWQWYHCAVHLRTSEHRCGQYGRKAFSERGELVSLTLGPQCPQKPPGYGAVEALRVPVDIGAPAVALAGRIANDKALGRPHNAQEFAFPLDFAAADAGPLW